MLGYSSGSTGTMTILVPRVTGAVIALGDGSNIAYTESSDGEFLIVSTSPPRQFGGIFSRPTVVTSLWGTYFHSGTTVPVTGGTTISIYCALYIADPTGVSPSLYVRNPATVALIHTFLSGESIDQGFLYPGNASNLNVSFVASQQYIFAFYAVATVADLSETVSLTGTYSGGLGMAP